MILNDKWVNIDISSIDWTQLQIYSGLSWHDIIYHKEYNDEVMIVYEGDEKPETMYVKSHELELRTKPIEHKKTLYLILFKSGACSVYNSKEEREKHISEIHNYELRDINLTWEVKQV